MRNSIRAIFTFSLILNMLLLGVLGGHAYRKWKHHPWQDVRQELSPTARNQAARIFQNAFRDIRSVGDEARKARAEMVVILSAETFDPEAFDAVAQKLATMRGEMTTLKIAATKEVASTLDVEDRRKMAERMTQVIGGGWEKRVHRDRTPRSLNAPAEEEKKKSSEE
ncbi:MAG: periplasmic heavy metal sensor [Alphaproteobacteria bacterium]|nr:periplasmic heavy metal sensor [Alphaproteobacteria bacterium]